MFKYRLFDGIAWCKLAPKPMCIKGCSGMEGKKEKFNSLESHNTGQFIAGCNLARHTDKTRQGSSRAASNPKEYIEKEENKKIWH